MQAENRFSRIGGQFNEAILAGRFHDHYFSEGWEKIPILRDTWSAKPATVRPDGSASNLRFHPGSKTGAATMRFFITGGAGFLGSHLADALLERGDEVAVLDVASDLKVRHQAANPRFRFVRESIFNRGILEDLVSWCDVVYHLAAVVGVDQYVNDPHKVLDVNINGTQNILSTALQAGKKVVFSSTSEVYGKSRSIPFHEEGERVLGSTKVDRWCYSTSKAVGEHFCFAFHRRGLPVVVLRYFNVYGPRLDQMDMGRVITVFLGQLMRGVPLTVIGDGRQTRSFTYVDDAIRATVAAGLAEEAVGPGINVGSAQEGRIQELAGKMTQLSRL